MFSKLIQHANCLLNIVRKYAKHAISCEGLILTIRNQIKTKCRWLSFGTSLIMKFVNVSQSISSLEALSSLLSFTCKSTYFQILGSYLTLLILDDGNGGVAI